MALRYEEYRDTKKTKIQGILRYEEWHLQKVKNWNTATLERHNLLDYWILDTHCIALISNVFSKLILQWNEQGWHCCSSIGWSSGSSGSPSRSPSRSSGSPSLQQRHRREVGRWRSRPSRRDEVEWYMIYVHYKIDQFCRSNYQCLLMSDEEPLAGIATKYTTNV